MKFPAWLVMVALLIGVVFGVVLTPGCFSQDQGTKGGTAAVKSNRDVDSMLFRVNDTPVYASELVTSPIMRKNLLEYTQSVVIRQMAEEEGVTVDPAEIDEEIERQKQSAMRKGESWEKMLRKQKLSEDEVREGIRWAKIIDKLAEKQAEITDEMIEEQWEKHQSSIVRRYLTRNSLPQSEETSVTLEMAHDLIYEDIYNTLRTSLVANIYAKVTARIDLDLVCLSDPEQKAHYEDLLVNIAKEDAQELLDNGDGLGSNPAGAGSEVSTVQGL